MSVECSASLGPLGLVVLLSSDSGQFAEEYWALRVTALLYCFIAAAVPFSLVEELLTSLGDFFSPPCTVDIFGDNLESNKAYK